MERCQGLWEMADKVLKKNFDSADIVGEITSGELIYKDIVDGQTELICRFDSEKKLIFVNDSFCLFFRKRRQDLFSHFFIEFIHEKDRRKSERLIASLTRTNPVTMTEFRVNQPGGDIRWQQWSIWAVFDDRGLRVEYQAVGRDLTERIMAEGLCVKVKTISEPWWKTIPTVS
jgi:PAS domain S-box-containing protein